MEEQLTTAADDLVCVECGRTAPAETYGWRVETLTLPGSSPDPGVAVFCPDCWQREFGD